MNSNKCCIIMTTTDNEEIANTIASILIKSKLAACVQFDEVRSFFDWEARFQVIKEYRLIIKALSSNYKLIEQKIKDHHNYEIPQIIKLEIVDGLPQYINWIREIIKK